MQIFVGKKRCAPNSPQLNERSFSYLRPNIVPCPTVRINDTDVIAPNLKKVSCFPIFLNYDVMITQPTPPKPASNDIIF